MVLKEIIAAKWVSMNRKWVNTAFGNPAQSFVLMNTQGFKTDLPVLISDNSSSTEEPSICKNDN